MAIFGNSPHGRHSDGGPSDTDRIEAGDGRGGKAGPGGKSDAFQPQEVTQVTSPKFQPGMPVKPQTGAFRPEPPDHLGREAVKAPMAAEPVEPPAPLGPPTTRGAGLSARGGDTKNLIVGPGIQLNGHISACDRLVVEGTVEADLNDAEAIEVAAGGLFKGAASIEEADISGRFEGTLTVKRRLIVRNGGRIEGTVCYAAIIIEDGGQISGQMDVYGEQKG
ncbi:bactofilin family protein [Rhodospira trueperi]|uniref:Protein CcmA, bactofilin family n=1 Tax=Rhodospira trueperi TaxID=69960 RepID=A0A1G6Z323_9PROT|nr:polymer-forming cytoskeletal protein [Rhodospira trueperi]SDD97164.1 protein CcmA, bactofilin family [Rhodospira trueperi]